MRYTNFFPSLNCRDALDRMGLEMLDVCMEDIVDFKSAPFFGYPANYCAIDKHSINGYTMESDFVNIS